MFKKSIILSLSIIFAIESFTPLNAGGSINDLQNKQASIQSQILEYRNEANALKNEKNSMQADIDSLQLEINALNLELQNYELQKQELNMKINLKEEEIIKLNKEIEENNKLLGERLRAMYKSGTSGYIELILNAENLTDAMTRVDMVQLIVESDVELLKSIEEQKKKVEEVKLSLENEKLELADVIKELSDKKESVETASKAKDDYISSLEQDIKSLELLMAAEEAQSSQIERDILSLQGAGEFSGGGMSWPLPGYSRISSYFGGRADPITGAWSNHRGIDIPGPYGQPIVSSNDGIVIFSGYHWSYGNYVIIDHGGGISTLYSHASKLLVGKGQAVSKGETIALVGSTGYSTGNHVHFEYRINGVPQNPLNYVK
jgi:murein DD-endopeptidase MepM/ murein hydrolase activator NlpD